MTEPVDSDYLHKTFELCPFHRHMSLELEIVGKGAVRVWVRYKPELNQAMGIFHGGVFAAALDAATYYAALSHYGRSGRLPLTQEYKINLLGSYREEDIVVTATLRAVQRGRRRSQLTPPRATGRRNGELHHPSAGCCGDRA
jgi:uncharacterized protein (TIGR00369 family)